MIHNTYAVMGNPIAHSLSPTIHQNFATQTHITLQYEKLLIPIDQFEHEVIAFFKRGGKGLNITQPFKERAFLMAQVKTPRCEIAGSANTLWQVDSVLHADNTDGIGLIRDLNNYIELNEKRILLLGAGGAAKGVIGALFEANPKSITLSNRTYEKAKILQRRFPALKIVPLQKLTQSYDLIINATSSSLNQQNLPLPTNILSNRPFCYDLAYQENGLTPFLQWADYHACEVADGLGMLIQQAAEAFFIWHRVSPHCVENFIKKTKG